MKLTLKTWMSLCSLVCDIFRNITTHVFYFSCGIGIEPWGSHILGKNSIHWVMNTVHLGFQSRVSLSCLGWLWTWDFPASSSQVTAITYCGTRSIIFFYLYLLEQEGVKSVKWRFLWRTEEVVGSLGANFTGSYEPFDKGTGIQTQVLWKSSKHS